jgi:LmbE family N-acetylglucosaminyl deacetylase
MIKRILSIHAHPDDAEILAGGTLALLAHAGQKITIVTMTPGDCGSAELAPGEISAVRRKEAEHAATAIGAEYLCAEFRDLEIYTDDNARRRVTEILRKTRPDLILTSSPVDYMIDHETTSSLVRDACFGAPVRNYLTGDSNPAPPLDAIPHLYFMDPIGGVDRDGRPIQPDFIVNVEPAFEEKKIMLSRHRSQREWLLKHHGIDDYLDTMERWTRECGRRAGLEFGEGFRLYKGHPYPQSPLLEELLGENLVKRPPAQPTG